MNVPGERWRGESRGFVASWEQPSASVVLDADPGGPRGAWVMVAGLALCAALTALVCGGVS